MMPGESEGLKGCASRTGEEPALALDPLALARRLAHMPFRSGQVRGRRVSFLLCPRSDISNLHRHLRPRSLITTAKIAVNPTRSIAATLW